MGNKVIRVETAKLDAVVKELLDGLTTDGGHHKQYSLESALLALTGKKFVEDARKEFQWESGIPS